MPEKKFGAVKFETNGKLLYLGMEIDMIYVGTIIEYINYWMKICKR